LLAGQVRAGGAFASRVITVLPLRRCFAARETVLGPVKACGRAASAWFLGRGQGPTPVKAKESGKKSPQLAGTAWLG